MTARADISTRDGDLHIVVTTDRERGSFTLSPIEARGLAMLLYDYAMRLLHVHASKTLDDISRPLRETK